MTSPGVTLLAALILTGAAALLAYDQQPVTTEARAVSYLAREVPAWRRDHPCYSCHNNGDAARALIAANSRRGDIGAALDDTLRWLAHPVRWESNGGGEGGADDKRLARIQFAYATTAAYAASLVPQEAVARAAEIVAGDQRPDGSWLLDSSDSIGSPATYGTALATVFARRTLQAANRRILDVATDNTDNTGQLRRSLHWTGLAAGAARSSACWPHAQGSGIGPSATVQTRRREVREDDTKKTGGFPPSLLPAHRPACQQRRTLGRRLIGGCTPLAHFVSSWRLCNSVLSALSVAPTLSRSPARDI